MAAVRQDFQLRRDDTFPIEVRFGTTGSDGVFVPRDITGSIFTFKRPNATDITNWDLSNAATGYARLKLAANAVPNSIKYEISETLPNGDHFARLYGFIEVGRWFDAA